MGGSKTAHVVAALACGVMLSGCITLYSKTEVLRGDEQRRPVRFENSKAAQLFNKEMKERSSAVGTTWLGVPFVTLYSRQKTLSDNAFFNDQVRNCDTDQDGVITELEARIYAHEDCPETDTTHVLPTPEPAPPPRPTSVGI